MWSRACARCPAEQCCRRHPSSPSIRNMRAPMSCCRREMKSRSFHPWRAADMRTAIVDEVIGTAGLLDEVQRDSNGAIVLFIGTVRNNTSGRLVTGIDYACYG